MNKVNYIDLFKQHLSALAVFFGCIFNHAYGYWEPTHQPAGLTVNCVYSNGTYLFAGTNFDGIYRSSDNGYTWLLVKSGGPVTAFAATPTCLFAVNGQAIYSSTNNGDTWSRADSGIKSGGTDCIATNGIIIYAGSDSGLYKSINNGSTWSAINNGIPRGTRIISIATSGSYVYAASINGYVFRSDNNGSNWSMLNVYFSSYNWTLAASGNNVFMGTNGRGVFLSRDNGNNWYEANLGLTPFIDVNVASFATGNGYIFAGIDSNVFYTPLDTINWMPLYDGWSPTVPWGLAIHGDYLYSGTSFDGVRLNNLYYTLYTYPYIITDGPTTFCSGDAVTLRVIGGSGFLWNTGATTRSITVTTSGNYTCRVNRWSDSITTGPVNVTVNPNTSATASSNSPVNSGNTLNLTSGGGTTYSWTGPNGFSSNQQNPSIPNATAINAGVYSVTVSNSYGCSSAATVPVFITGSPLLFEKLYTAASPYSTYLSDAIATLDGGYAMVGTANNYTNSSQSIVAVKTDGRGNYINGKVFGIIHLSWGGSIVQTYDGGYLIAGVTSQDFGYGVFLLKTNAAFDTTWTHLYAANEIPKLSLTADSGFLLSGFGTMGGTEILKLDQNGNIVFSGGISNIDGNYNSFAESVKPTADKGFVVAGWQDSSAWLAKFDYTNTVQWVKLYKSPAYQQTYAVQQTLDGGYILAGYVYGNGTGYDMCLIKTNAVGDTTWVRTYGTADDEEAYDIIQTPDSGYIFTGNGGILKADKNGNLLWRKMAKDAADGRSIQPTYDNGYIILTNANNGLVKIDGDGNSTCIKDSLGIITGSMTMQVKSPSYIENSGGYLIGAAPMLNDYFWVYADSCIASYVITTNAISPAVYCSGDSIHIPYSVNVSFNAGNVFSAQLSDASGSFGSPVIIGALTSVTSGTINALIPSNTPTGTHYRVRVVSSNPVVTGSANGANLTINSPSTLWYRDNDGDGYGTSTSSVTSCTQPAGYVSNNADCNDNDATIHALQTYYIDADHDGYGSTATASLCVSSLPTGYSTNNTDCNDNNAAVNPGVAEVPCNGIDDNCNGVIDEGSPVLPAPGTINGPVVAVCEGATVTYSITPVTGAITYTWTGSNKITIVSGQGTDSVTVHFERRFKNGTLSVTANNACGSSPARSINIYSIPSSPVITGTTTVCPNTIETYSVNPVDGATSYNWIAPRNALIKSGQGTVSVTISFGSRYNNGWLYVNAVNSCGTSTRASLNISKDRNCRMTIDAGDMEIYDLAVYPNPAHDKLTVEFSSTIDGNASFTLFDLTGRKVMDRKSSFVEGDNLVEIDLADLSKGIYMLLLQTEYYKKEVKVAVE